MLNQCFIACIYCEVLPDMIPLCLYGAVVERTNLNVNFSIHKSVVMLSVTTNSHFQWSFLNVFTSTNIWTVFTEGWILILVPRSQISNTGRLRGGREPHCIFKNNQKCINVNSVYLERLNCNDNRMQLNKLGKQSPRQMLILICWYVAVTRSKML